MFGRKEKRALEALPPEHRQLAAERTLAVTQAPAQWIELFASLTHHDDSVHRHPLDPRLMGVVAPVVRAIAEDLEPDAPLGARIDLRGWDAPGKAGPAQPVPRPGRGSTTQTLAWDPWLVVEAKLRNRIVLDLTVVDAVRVRRISKVSASGKHKSKTKSRLTQRITVKLSLPPGMAFVPVAPSPATSWLQVTARPRGDRNIVVARAKLALPGLPQPQWQRSTLLLAIAEAFRWVPPTTAGAGAPAAAGSPA